MARKKEIVQRVADTLGLPQLRIKKIVQKTLDTIIETIVEEERVEFQNFGIFEVRQRAARTAHNPKTGEKVDVPAKCVVAFKLGKVMEEKVDKLIKNKKNS